MLHPPDPLKKNVATEKSAGLRGVHSSYDKHHFHLAAAKTQNINKDE